jgi:hypothetical protein
MTLWRLMHTGNVSVSVNLRHWRRQDGMMEAQMGSKARLKGDRRRHREQNGIELDSKGGRVVKLMDATGIALPLQELFAAEFMEHPEWLEKVRKFSEERQGREIFITEKGKLVYRDSEVIMEA